jgi:hypothetical protein
LDDDDKLLVRMEEDRKRMEVHLKKKQEAHRYQTIANQEYNK